MSGKKAFESKYLYSDNGKKGFINDMEKIADDNLFMSDEEESSP